MFGRLSKEESGAALPLAIFTMVMIGVMGVGLLTFVRADLNTVVEVNQGQKAFEVADAGIKAAEQQLVADGGLATRYDGGSDDSQWSSSKPNSSCLAGLGNRGMCLNNLDGDDSTSDNASVTIETNPTPAGSYKAVSTGGYGDAKRKIEAILVYNPAVDMPRGYFTRGALSLAGSATVQGVSLFALGDVYAMGSSSLGTAEDAYFGRWAETSGLGPYPNSVGSYPNGYNKTPRGSSSASEQTGIGSLGSITTSGAADVSEGTRSFDSTPPDPSVPTMVSDYDASPLPDNKKIAFPFRVPTQSEDKKTIEALRQRALALERANPGTAYYIDSSPGNGVDDAGRSNGPVSVDSWYAGSDFETVRFYEFETYKTANVVTYASSHPNIPSSCSPASPARGLIVVQNGDVDFGSNKEFQGGIVVRAYDSSGNLRTAPTGSPLPKTDGSFRGADGSCLRGYANASGNTIIEGSVAPGSVPELGSLDAFQASVQVLSWRELYQ